MQRRAGGGAFWLRRCPDSVGCGGSGESAGTDSAAKVDLLPSRPLKEQQSVAVTRWRSDGTDYQGNPRVVVTYTPSPTSGTRTPRYRIRPRIRGSPERQPVRPVICDPVGWQATCALTKVQAETPCRSSWPTVLLTCLDIDVKAHHRQPRQHDPCREDLPASHREDT